MAITVITSSEWALSLQGVGLIVQGVDDIKQCIFIILTTVKGSVPFNNLFGCDALQQQDQPVNKVISTMSKNIIEALAIWETRITVISVTHKLSNGEVDFLISYSVNSAGLNDSTIVSFGL